MVVLPGYLHTGGLLPNGDADYPGRVLAGQALYPPAADNALGVGEQHDLQEHGEG